MKTLKNIGLLFLATIILTSCSPEENGTTATSSVRNVLPENNKSFTADEARQPITFRWTPIVPKPQQVIAYKLRVWQLMQGQNGTAAMRENQPKITRFVTNASEITIESFYTGPCKPPYLCDFVWSVQVISLDGTPTGTVIATTQPTAFYF